MKPLVASLLFATAVVCSSCAPRSMAPQVHGIWNPQVGSGAVYRLNSKDGEPMQLKYAVVGKEAGNYWIESTIGETKTKVLLDPTAAKAERMIVQSPGNPPVDVSQVMKIGQSIFSSYSDRIARTDIQQTGTVIGKETIKTAAGSFATTHYRSGSGDELADIWIADAVRPYGLVKMQTADGTSMELVQVLKNAASEITEAVQ